VAGVSADSTILFDTVGILQDLNLAAFCKIVKGMQTYNRQQRSI